ncbi:MAG: phosphoribosylamine--glycine ligase, partial [Victivallaceae bacterium]|nr:phosphoribosylamine--glycine ligase [Victivallaceae bacterium]
MNILVVGSGGREHVLCWKLAQSPLCDKLYCAPGNAGIAKVAECVPIEVGELEKLADFAVAHQIGLTVVGPEAPLCAGIVNVFRSRNLAVFGPDQYAAGLEGSKEFAKNFMVRNHIPTAKARSFTDAAAAGKYIREEFASGETAIVVKADGLAAGKGVLVAESADEACAFTDECFSGAFGASGSKVLIEECLVGEEASIFALTDGKTIVPLASSQDHKRVFDGDKGPNTGGMGAYSPAPVVTAQVMKIIEQDILNRFLSGIQKESLDFRGVIFVGVMVTDKGPKVLEFNVRFGDPEAQPVLRRLKGDLADIMLKTVEGNLASAKLSWDDDVAVSVVIASGGYPGHYQKGYEITGLDQAETAGAVVFHAG